MNDEETVSTGCVSSTVGGGIDGATFCGCAECVVYEAEILADAGLLVDERQAVDEPRVNHAAAAEGVRRLARYGRESGALRFVDGEAD